jgi:hypothetical protein
VDTPQAEPAAAAESKKIDSPVGTQGSDLGAEDAGGDADLVKCGSRLVPRWLSWFYDKEKGRWNVSRKTVIAALENIVCAERPEFSRVAA